MASAQRRSIRAHALILLVGMPFFALLGLWHLALAIAWPFGALRRLRAARADAIACPNGHPNSTVGRYECSRCHAQYHGWVGCCAVCGAGAGWITCSTCGIAIRLPWRRP